jgi:Bacterial Ig-like domain (group 2)
MRVLLAGLTLCLVTPLIGCRNDVIAPTLSHDSPSGAVGGSAKKIPFDGFAFDCGSTGGEITQNGNMLHIRGRLNSGIFLSDNDMLTGELTVLVHSVNINLRNSAGSFRGTLTLKPAAHPDASWEGDFAGHLKGAKLESNPLTLVDARIVVQGQGAFHGMSMAFDHFINPAFDNPFDTPSGCQFVGERWTGVIVNPPTVASVEVSSAQPMTWIGSTRQLTAVARTASGMVIDGTTFTWVSSVPDVATVNPSGLVTAATNGTTTVSATAGTVTGSTTMTVQQAVHSVTVTRAVDTILAAGQTKSFTAAARDSGDTDVAAAAIRWSSANTGVATIDALTGLATASGTGVVTLTASAGAVAGNASLVVRNGTLVGDRVLLTDYGNVNDNDYVVDDYFVVWWNNAYNWESAARQILNWLKGVKAECLELGLSPPPNVARGTYLNIYLHEPGPGNDNYPDGWGAGVGTDGNNLPFLSVGSAQRNDALLFRHEGFHLFQYTDTRLSPGFEYAGDGSWYTEAVATWFAALAFPTDVNTQLGAATVPANPQLALWHGWTNTPPGDPVNWNRTTRQYALSTWLDYLTTTGGAPVSVLLGGYITPTVLLPQEYLNSQVGDLGAIFADYAAASTPDMPYLTRPQWTAALGDLATYGVATDRHEYVLEFVDAGTGGVFVDPPAALRPRGWGWNVIRVSSTQAASWRFEVNGSPTGSEGATAAFQARLLVRTAGGRTVQTVPLADALDGFLDVATTEAATELYLIVVAVPQHFRGSQTYSYRVKIDRS